MSRYKVLLYNNSIERWTQLFSDAAYQDIYFQVGEETIRANRMIVGSSCDYFRVLLFANTFSEGTKNAFPIDGVDADIFRVLIKYCYTHAIECCMGDLDLMELGV